MLDQKLTYKLLTNKALATFYREFTNYFVGSLMES